jgi:hypothetical protein
VLLKRLDYLKTGLVVLWAAYTPILGLAIVISVLGSFPCQYLLVIVAVITPILTVRFFIRSELEPIAYLQQPLPPTSPPQGIEGQGSVLVSVSSRLQEPTVMFPQPLLDSSAPQLPV